MIENIEAKVEKYHWLRQEEDGSLSMFLDHHALSSFRMCEAYFDLAIIQGRAPKGGPSWPLAFGAVFHTAVEYLYKSKAISKFDPEQLKEIAVREWHKAKLEQFNQHKTYIALGGLPGFIALIMQYVSYYSGDLERMRPIATEVPFGKAKEVPLGEFSAFKQDFDFINMDFEINVKCYLTGRIDFLMDSGTAIGPMDHKTSAQFKNNPMNTYETQEGMTGYIFATNHIVRHNFPELTASRSLDRMWMNFIQIKSEPDSNKRFRRVPLFKTPWQLEQYKARQISTFKKIFDLFVLEQGTPDWNTNVCNSWWYQECPFRRVHRQSSEQSMLIVLNSDYEVREPWDPEKIGGSEGGDD